MTNLISKAEALEILQRAAKNVSQKKLAARLEITPQHLNDVLNGRRCPSRILDRFGVEKVVMYRIRKHAIACAALPKEG
jgi:Helix-turn-helix